jgi:CheY-like chemotaxis protein
VVNNQLPADHPLHQEVEQIRKAGERAAALTRQLLAFSRTQVLLPQLIDVGEIVTDIDRMLRRLIGEDIDLVTICDPRTGRVKADPGQLEQVLMNLAVNARDAMPGGGRLTIETRRVDFDEADAREHVSARPGSYVMIAVSDTGSGMDAETKAHIFEPFFTTKEKGKGTGLGLATVYGIVKQSGGFLRVSSEPGSGTMFKICLPRVEEEPDSRRPPPPPALENARGTETVLLLEDEEGLRRLGRQALEDHGYTVVEASGWPSVLDRAARLPPIDLVLTGVALPESGGPEIVSRLSALRPGIRILSMAGSANDAMDAGVAHLQKPFVPGDLVRSVRQLLDS